MKWTLQYSNEALKFAEREKLFDEIRQEIKKLVQRIKGENMNIDIRKLKGEWSGYYRISKGKLRIIFTIEKENKIIFIERIDYRGEVYK
ncbi:MAG: type II toxin-antitoxin system RelE/ParE family toxin [Candidatus Aenigmatarchaeota archaeon]